MTGRRPRALISLLVGLHPKRWRAEYGDEYRALLEQTPLTARIVADVLGAAVRLQLAARRVVLCSVAALLLSSIGEVIAVHGGYSDNILWIPSSAVKLMLLAAVILPWVAVIAVVRGSRAQQRESARSTRG
jgi:hypothetical protein